MRRATSIIIVLLLAVTACKSSADQTGPNLATTQPTAVTTVAPTTSVAPTTTTSTSTTTTIPPIVVTGTVTDETGGPLPGVTVTSDTTAVTTGADGLFDLTAADPTITLTKPAWLPLEVDWSATSDAQIIMDPRIVRAVRVARYTYLELDGLEGTLELIKDTPVNAIVFDTKDEVGTTLYATAVPFANDIAAVEDFYDPIATLETVHAAGLYAITRIVTFEDPIWTKARPEAKLAGKWIDARNPDNWEYPLALAVEACELGFDEIQFDYVRFPAGSTAGAAPPTTQEERLTAITGFLEEARSRLHPLGCAVSADIFGITASSPTDEGIGQRPDELSAVVDALSPMIYPSHYSPGWLGFADPNDHPGPVTADALDGAMPRMAPGSLLRPWLQAFYYNSNQIRAAIDEAESRGLGWILWNAVGRYSRSALVEE
ncbi:MAG: hypothetical protein OEY55_02715 [Acidimicrobiia bacterium]|nr:hypothetical protein [Acidimicrobiia bacterium]MDH5420701.1 hypothetical protein [Acidimicrobiia bacterium]MDH5503937.1 hypothetical protein [Acidimicrobiia bacterium]